MSDALLGTGPHARRGHEWRLSILSTRFLGDAAKVDFWVLATHGRPCRGGARCRSPSRLQAVFLFDEADLCLPAETRQPAITATWKTCSSRLRSAGVGIFLATQSPGGPRLPVPGKRQNHGLIPAESRSGGRSIS